jgi:two-component sensor histidine kinase
MLGRFEGRLGALSAAHGILTKERWEAVPLRRLICDTFTAVRSDDERLKLEGPDLDLPPKVSVSLAMAIHELATNALKYGSLSNETGQVAISWTTDEQRLRLHWKERGGPPVREPDRRGFGSRMIERGLAAELGGKVAIRFEPDGVSCEVDAPLPAHV